jgi:1-acyl-sn-glycerol-3-phosphate acyltransferase
MKKFSRFLLKLFGWDIDEHAPEGIDKCVVVVGPHTSNWDFIIGRLAFLSYGVKTGILIKKELFFFPLGYILKALGGVPIDRKSNNKFTDQAKAIFDSAGTMYMVFTPEGTRSYNPNWKKGFYYVAQKVGVPIYIAYMDYERKIGGFLEHFEPTGDVEKDIAYIKGKLSQYKGRFPEKGIRRVEDE